MANENNNTIDNNVEGRATPMETIRKNSTKQGSKSAGMVGASNANAA